MRMVIAYSASMLCAMSFALVLLRNARMPYLMDLGFALLSLGMFFTAEGLFTGSECNVQTIAFRWIFNGGGVLLLILGHFMNTKGPPVR
jgi:hypothetical protein